MPMSRCFLPFDHPEAFFGGGQPLVRHRGLFLSVIAHHVNCAVREPIIAVTDKAG
jgi:hypothetical protein